MSVRKLTIHHTSLTVTYVLPTYPGFLPYWQLLVLFFTINHALRLSSIVWNHGVNIWPALHPGNVEHSNCLRK